MLINRISVKLLGVGAIDVCLADSTHIYIDAFNTINSVPPLQENDLVIFTHADGDHFSFENIIVPENQDDIVVI
jgi:hypothetical protein